MNEISREDLLGLPVSMRSWIILREYAFYHADLAVYLKIIEEYLEECPLFEVYNLMTRAHDLFRAPLFQKILEKLFQINAEYMEKSFFRGRRTLCLYGRKGFLTR